MILGNKQLGVPGDGAFDHTTVQGFVKQRDGHYADALRRGKQVIPLIAEVFGGLAPHGYRFLVHLSRVTAEHTTRDTTKYSKCAASYLTYHSQRISHAIVMHDGRA